MPAIVNLHFTSRWLDLPTFLGSLPAGLPVVWSLHDLNPLTGGCHHPLDCVRFHEHCHHCPQLKRPSARDYAYRNFRLKDRAYAGLNLHFVGNSEWTTSQAKQSALARHARSFRTIPLGINLQEFAPVERAVARQALRLPEDAFVLGFACADLSDTNKGLATLLEAIRMLGDKCPVTLLTFGAGKLPAAAPSAPSAPVSAFSFQLSAFPAPSPPSALSLGPLASSRLQSLYYSALDLFAAPSRVETFGLTALEAMACGTPVLAFKTSGLAEVVADGKTGILEPEIGSAAGLARQLEWFINHPADRLAMGQAARAHAEKLFSAELMAQRYIQLYESLIK